MINNRNDINFIKYSNEINDMTLMTQDENDMTNIDD